MPHLWRPVGALGAACGLLLASGCGGVTPAVATFANTTQPVLLGPVTHIGGDPEGASGEAISRFHVEAVNLYRQFLQIFPQDAQADSARFRQGMALHHRGDFGAARSLLESSVAGEDTAPLFRAALLALGDSA